jgi:HEAT repeat protein
MSGYGCFEFRADEALLQDGLLEGERAGHALAHLAACLPCQRSFASEEGLDLALAQAFASGAAAGSQASRWQRRWLPPAAAAAAALLLWAGFRLGSADQAGAAPPAAWAAGAALCSPAEGLAVAVPGGGRLHLAPHAMVRMHEGPRLDLAVGGLAYETLESGLLVEAPGGDLRLEGTGFLVRSGIGSEEALLVMPARGRADFQDRGGEAEALALGESHLLTADGPRSVASVLHRLSELDGDESLVVLTSEELMERESRQQAVEDDLEARIGDLLAEIARLRIENAALQARGTALTLEEIYRTVGEKADQAPGSRRFELLSWVRVAARASEGHEGESLEIARRTLLAPEHGLSRRKVGLFLVGRMAGPEAGQVLAGFLRSDEPELRLAAAEALSERPRAESRGLLLGVFAGETDPDLRLAAATGLVRLGDYGAPLEWLKAEYDRSRGSSRARLRILGRILAAPLDRIGPFLAGTLADPHVDLAARRELVRFLGRVASGRSVEILRFLRDAGLEPSLAQEVDRELHRCGVR